MQYHSAEQQATIDRLHKLFRQRERGPNIPNSAVSFDAQGRLDVDSDVSLRVRRPKIPIRFGAVSGRFNVNDRGLTTLENSPESCSDFYCIDNQLSDLRGGPRHVVDYYNATANQLTSLTGAPESVKFFYIQRNQLSSLVGCPHDLQELHAWNNPFETLEGLPRSAKIIYVQGHPNLGLLRLLLVKGLKTVGLGFGNSEPEAIIKRYLGRGANGVMPCAAELIKAGYRGNARL